MTPFKTFPNNWQFIKEDSDLLFKLLTDWIGQSLLASGGAYHCQLRALGLVSQQLSCISSCKDRLPMLQSLLCAQVYFVHTLCMWQTNLTWRGSFHILHFNKDLRLMIQDHRNIDHCRSTELAFLFQLSLTALMQTINLFLIIKKNDHNFPLITDLNCALRGHIFQYHILYWKYT